MDPHTLRFGMLLLLPMRPTFFSFMTHQKSNTSARRLASFRGKISSRLQLLKDPVAHR
jgi:hypothetical protein